MSAAPRRPLAGSWHLVMLEGIKRALAETKWNGDRAGTLLLLQMSADLALALGARLPSRRPAADPEASG